MYNTPEEALIDYDRFNNKIKKAFNVENPDEYFQSNDWGKIIGKPDPSTGSEYLWTRFDKGAATID